MAGRVIMPKVPDTMGGGGVGKGAPHESGPGAGGGGGGAAAPPPPPTPGPYPIQAGVLAQVAHLTPPPASGPPPVTKASPLARKLAEQRGVDLRTVQGTGPGGRVFGRDGEAA